MVFWSCSDAYRVREFVRVVAFEDNLLEVSGVFDDDFLDGKVSSQTGLAHIAESAKASFCIQFLEACAYHRPRCRTIWNVPYGVPDV